MAARSPPSLFRADLYMSSYVGAFMTWASAVPFVLKQQSLRLLRGQVSSGEVLALFALIPAVYYLCRMAQRRSVGAATASPAKPVPQNSDPDDARATDPLLLQKNSELKSFTTSRFTYPAIRVFYRRHPQTDQLPSSPAPLPLIVCIHGLGGSVAQFHPLLTSLTNISSCLAVDLPGCGISEFAPTSWDAYATDALAELLETVIDAYREKRAGQKVILVGHSMGCSLAVRLASKSCAHWTDLAHNVVGFVAICPTLGPSTEKQVILFRTLLWIPGTIFDLWRAWDRRGGLESASVRRFVGADADLEAKKLQHRFNNQSKTPVWRRMAWGCLPVYENGTAKGGLPGADVWAGLGMPVFLVGGAEDHVTPPAEVGKIAALLGGGNPPLDDEDSDHATQAVPDSAAPIDSSTAPEEHVAETIDDIRDEDFRRERRLNNPEESYEDPSTPNEKPPQIPPQPMKPKKFVKSLVLPPPATHALLYTPSTARVLAGLVTDFLACHITRRLSLGWQLQFLSREGKWDVKNLTKWKKVRPVSDPVADVFRAMKTLREVDEDHCPEEFVRRWGSVVKDIVDISHDNPVYDPRALERAGINYHKFPTVSKIPPTDAEVEAFVALVDRLRSEQKRRAEEAGWGDGCVIGVHCHYGFNRTGYFIVCYLVERCGFGVQAAIEAFAKARPNGIRHSHFLDRLFVRYSGLKEQDEAE